MSEGQHCPVDFILQYENALAMISLSIAHGGRRKARGGDRGEEEIESFDERAEV